MAAVDVAGSGVEAARAAGVSLWLDALSREMLESGELTGLVEAGAVQGVTTNPAIFSAAIRGESAAAYASEIAACAAEGLGPAETVQRLTAEDVRRACEVLLPVYEQTNGEDGYVSIEVDPLLAHDAAATVEQARQLASLISRPNLMVKIPATDAGIEAIPQVLGTGINVNVTLIFSLPRYREVLNAYQAGLEVARGSGHDISRVRSVASVFVSRFDTLLDPVVSAATKDTAASELTPGRAGVANSLQCFDVLQQSLTSVRWQMLENAGAHPQRLLWASTGVKDARLTPTHYVSELLLPGTVNTVPLDTLQACLGVSAEALATTAPQGPVDERIAAAAVVLSAIARLPHGDYAAACERLESEGVEKFVQAWQELLDDVEARLAAM